MVFNGINFILRRNIKILSKFWIEGNVVGFVVCSVEIVDKDFL